MILLKNAIQALSKELEIPFFETSAKDDICVEAAFRTLVAKMLVCESPGIRPTCGSCLPIVSTDDSDEETSNRIVYVSSCC